MEGDKLARGAATATFPQGENIAKDKWAAAFDDFDPEVWKKKAEKDSSDAKTHNVTDDG